MRFRNRSAIVASLLFSMAVSGRAADRDTLKDLRAVDVLIEDLAPEVEADGLTTAQLRADVESRLREFGIEVTKDASEAFYVNVNAHRITTPGTPGTDDPDGRYIYNIELDVNQPVAVLRTNTIALATTWTRATVGITLLGRLAESVRRDVRDVVDLFIDDYLFVNPKP